MIFRHTVGFFPQAGNLDRGCAKVIDFGTTPVRASTGSGSDAVSVGFPPACLFLHLSGFLLHLSDFRLYLSAVPASVCFNCGCLVYLRLSA